MKFIGLPRGSAEAAAVQAREGARIAEAFRNAGAQGWRLLAAQNAEGRRRMALRILELEMAEPPVRRRPA